MQALKLAPRGYLELEHGIPSSRSLRERILPARVASRTGLAQASFFILFFFIFSVFFTIFYEI
jgi:hypothetical protein